MAVLNMNAEQFKQSVKESDKPVLVDFWAPWCGYCRRIGPAFDKLGDQYDGILVTGKVNIDEEPQLAEELGVEVIPTLILYRGGEKAGSIVAPESKAKIEAFIQETLAQ